MYRIGGRYAFKTNWQQSNNNIAGNSSQVYNVLPSKYTKLGQDYKNLKRNGIYYDVLVYIVIVVNICRSVSGFLSNIQHHPSFQL